MSDRSAADAHLADLRLEYKREVLDERDVDADPFRQFAHWFSQARSSLPREPNAMTIATASPDGAPSARVVLMKGFDERGFTFFTNYDSHKGTDLARNPRAALLFYWGELERQIRLEGTIERLTAEESDEYFSSRPLGSRLGAWASEQSRAIAGRDVLEGRVRDLEAEYAEGDPPRPAFWGGYRLSPTSFEFWQGRPSRLHDRISYRRQPDGAWQIVRLQP